MAASSGKWDESNPRQTVQVARLLARFVVVSCIHTRPDESSVSPTFAPHIDEQPQPKGGAHDSKESAADGPGVFVICAGSLPSATTTTTVGANVNITKAAGSQAEGTIAVNPTNPLELFAAYNPPNTAFWRSTDGGATWVAAGAGIGASCCDDVAAWDDLRQSVPRQHQRRAQRDRAVSEHRRRREFHAPADDRHGFDRSAVREGGAGSVWVTWNDGAIKARGAAVTGLGAVGAFTAMQSAPGTSGQFGDIAIGPSGQVVVVYQESNSPCPCRIFANTDADGLGAGGFGPQVTVTSTNVDTFDSITPQAARTIDAEANLAWDRSGGPHNGRLYLSYTDETPDESNNTDIVVRHSDDNGATWSAALKVNDDATTTSAVPSEHLARPDHRHPRHAPGTTPATTRATTLTQFWGAVSDDGGASFLPTSRSAPAGRTRHGREQHRLRRLHLVGLSRRQRST